MSIMIMIPVFIDEWNEGETGTRSHQIIPAKYLPHILSYDSIKYSILNLTLYSIDTHSNASTTAFENIVGKGEIACNKQFLLFPQFFQLNQVTVHPFAHIFLYNFICFICCWIGTA